MDKKLRISSLCVHAGYHAKNGEPIELPIIQSTTFKYDDSDEMAQLFDLKKDPQQLHNLYGEPGTERLVARLRAELVRLQTLYQDPIAEKNGF